MSFSKISEVLEDLSRGKIIILVDDEDRENEGDFVCLADQITDEKVNFMITIGKGLLCVPLLGERCDQLQLPSMVSENTDVFGTSFTVSVDLKNNGVTTGISALDRSKTIKALTSEAYHAKDFNRPGHIFPLRAKPGGVLERSGHTEAAVDLAKLSGSNPAGVIIEIINKDGTMARLPQLEEIAKLYKLKLFSIRQLVDELKA